jgi:hypothetical protein
MASNRNSTHNRAMPAAGMVVLTLLLAMFMSAGFAGATSLATSSSPQTIWAYGAVKTVDFQGTSQGGWQYSGNATYGFSVILNQTNTSATSFELSANRTMGALFQVHYCYPNCQSPHYFGNLTDHLYETIAASSNLTNAGLVYEGGVPVSAIALNNSQSHLRANVTESSSSYLPTALGLGPAVSRSNYLGANVVASSAVDLTPGLGILPVDLSAAQSWNSSAQFNAHAAASFDYYYRFAGPHASGAIGPLHGNLSVPSSGTVSLYGSYSPANTITLGGVTYPEVALKLVGPFAVREGFLLLPATTDLFGGSGQPWGTQQNGSATASMSYLDARASEGGHLGIGASEWGFDSSTLNPASVASGGSSPALLSTYAGPAPDSAPATTLQGMPETVSSATAQQSCLVTGGGCPSANGPTASGLRGLVGLLAVGVVLVVVVLAVVLVAERRRMPPPTYPNAALYPPGTTRPGVRTPPSNPSAPPEDDPLRNLW